MIGRRTVPLGIDLGTRRVRVALAERVADAAPALLAVAARDVAMDAAAALRDALHELGTRERRCVVGLGAPEAIVRAIGFPPMSARERRRAARFEAERFATADGAIVSLAPLPDAGVWALGIAGRTPVTRQRAAVAAAGLRAVAVDDVQLALRRVLPGAGAIVDIGAEATRVTVVAEPLPHVTHLPTGGDAFTAAITDALGIDSGSAEARKRVHGFAGAGEARRDALIADVIAAIGSAQTMSGVQVHSIVLTGNGSRVPGLVEAFAQAGGIPTRIAELDPQISPSLPADVLRAAGADWALAVGLALRQTSA